MMTRIYPVAFISLLLIFSGGIYYAESADNIFTGMIYEYIDNVPRLMEEAAVIYILDDEDYDELYDSRGSWSRGELDGYLASKKNIDIPAGTYSYIIEDSYLLERIGRRIYAVIVSGENIGTWTINYTRYDLDSGRSLEQWAYFCTDETLWTDREGSHYPGGYFAGYSEKMVFTLLPPSDRLGLDIVPNSDPLVLVHGLNGEAGYWGVIPGILSGIYGIQVWELYYPNDEAAMSLVPVIDGALFTVSNLYDRGNVTIAAHSYGGLVSRTYLTSGSYKKNVSKFLMIGTPNNGSFAAWAVSTGIFADPYILGLIDSLAPDQYAAAYIDISPSSSLTWHLHENQIPEVIESLVIAGTKNDLGYGELKLAYLYNEAADHSDGLVSISSASLLDQGIPLALFSLSHAELCGTHSDYSKGYLDGAPRITEAIALFSRGSASDVGMEADEYFTESGEVPDNFNPLIDRSRAGLSARAYLDGALSGFGLKLDPAPTVAAQLEDARFLTFNNTSRSYFWFWNYPMPFPLSGEGLAIPANVNGYSVYLDCLEGFRLGEARLRTLETNYFEYDIDGQHFPEAAMSASGGEIKDDVRTYSEGDTLGLDIEVVNFDYPAHVDLWVILLTPSGKIYFLVLGSSGVEFASTPQQLWRGTLPEGTNVTGTIYSKKFPFDETGDYTLYSVFAEQGRLEAFINKVGIESFGFEDK